MPATFYAQDALALIKLRQDLRGEQALFDQLDAMTVECETDEAFEEHIENMLTVNEGLSLMESGLLSPMSH